MILPVGFLLKIQKEINRFHYWGFRTAGDKSLEKGSILLLDNNSSQEMSGHFPVDSPSGPTIQHVSHPPTKGRCSRFNSCLTREMEQHCHLSPISNHAMGYPLKKRHSTKAIFATAEKNFNRKGSAPLKETTPASPVPLRDDRKPQPSPELSAVIPTHLSHQGWGKPAIPRVGIT